MTMITFEENKMWKTEVSIAIEKVLKQTGKFEYRQVLETLRKNHRMTFMDCYDKPLILKQVLKELFGNAYDGIVNSIEGELNGLAIMEPVQEFLIIMKK